LSARSAPDRAPLYQLLRRLLRLVLGIFFRQIEVVGEEHVPAEGPLILAGNHPNSLIDPGLLVAVTERPVRFAAKDVLFRSALLRPVLTAAGAVPLARRSDHGEGPLDNNAAFDTLTAALDAGGAMGIFPEGCSHDDAHLHQLKTGAARIALAFVAQTGRRPTILPVGLNYVHRKRFRSRVLVQSGAPVPVDDALVEQAKTDSRAAARELTDRLEHGLRALTINAPDWQTVRVLDAVRRLYQPPHISLEARIELGRRFTSVYETVKDAPEILDLYKRIEDWLDRLDALGLRDRDLARRISVLELGARAVGHAALLFFWLPLALAGGILHAPIGLAIRFAGPLITPRKDVLATTKLMLGFVTMPLVAAGFVGVAWWWGGLGWALCAAEMMPVSGLATLRVLERGAALRRLLDTTWRVAGFRKEITALREERRSLEAAVLRIVERFKPAGMVSLFPRDASPEPRP